MNSVDIEAEKRGILRHLKALETVENSKDIMGVLDLIAEDFVFAYRENMVEGKQETEAMLREAVKDYTSSEHIPLRVEVSLSGDVAWLLGHELNKRKRVEGIVETKQSYMITFRKAEGKWKEVAVCLT